MIYLVLYIIGAMSKQQTKQSSFIINPWVNVRFKVIKTFEFKKISIKFRKFRSGKKHSVVVDVRKPWLIGSSGKCC